MPCALEAQRKETYSDDSSRVLGDSLRIQIACSEVHDVVAHSVVNLQRVSSALICTPSVSAIYECQTLLHVYTN